MVDDRKNEFLESLSDDLKSDFIQGLASCLARGDVFWIEHTDQRLTTPQEVFSHMLGGQVDVKHFPAVPPPPIFGKGLKDPLRHRDKSAP